MAPVLLTGLTKITDQPDEVVRCILSLSSLSYYILRRMKNFMCWPTLESVVWLSESSANIKHVFCISQFLMQSFMYFSFIVQNVYMQASTAALSERYQVPDKDL